ASSVWRVVLVLVDLLQSGRYARRKTLGGFWWRAAVVGRRFGGCVGLCCTGRIDYLCYQVLRHNSLAFPTNNTFGFYGLLLEVKSLASFNFHFLFRTLMRYRQQSAHIDVLKPIIRPSVCFRLRRIPF